MTAARRWSTSKHPAVAKCSPLARSRGRRRSWSTLASLALLATCWIDFCANPFECRKARFDQFVQLATLHMRIGHAIRPAIAVLVENFLQRHVRDLEEVLGPRQVTQIV